MAPRFASSAAADTKARELPEPPAVEEVIKQRSAKLKEELLQEVQKTTKEQASSTNEAIASLKTLLQSTLEKKDSTCLRALIDSTHRLTLRLSRPVRSEGGDQHAEEPAARHAGHEQLQAVRPLSGGVALRWLESAGMAA